MTIEKYNAILNFAASKMYFKGAEFSNIITSMDVAHSAIADPEFNGKNYRLLVTRKVYELLYERKHHKRVDMEFMDMPYHEEKYPCQRCENMLGKKWFVHSHTHCNRCYRKLNLEARREASRKYYQNNKEKAKESTRRYLAKKDPEAVRAYQAAAQRKYREKNRDKIRVRAREDYHRKKALKNGKNHH